MGPGVDVHGKTHAHDISEYPTIIAKDTVAGGTKAAHKGRRYLAKGTAFELYWQYVHVHDQVGS